MCREGFECISEEEIRNKKLIVIRSYPTHHQAHDTLEIIDAPDAFETNDLRHELKGRFDELHGVRLERSLCEQDAISQIFLVNPNEEQSVFDEQMRMFLQEKFHELNAFAIDDPPFLEGP